MRIVILYHPNDEKAGAAEDYKRDFEREQQGKRMDLVSLETVQGSDMAKIYDVVRYPAILVISQDGQLQKFWQDDFPLMQEVAAYAR